MAGRRPRRSPRVSARRRFSAATIASRSVERPARATFKHRTGQRPVVTGQPAALEPLRTEIRQGELDLHEFVDATCDAIERVDPSIRAFVAEIDRRPRLHAAAAHRLAAHPEPASRPPLFGVPVGVKDVVHVAGFTTRAGSALPPSLFAGPEATAVTALRDAGATVVGKTVTTEFAGPAPASTRNPRDLDHTPGGSSSGSAAAVAAGLCPLAIGTQTSGSVIRPAAFCGVVGFTPSSDRVPTDGVVPVAESMDTVGLFTQDVAGMRAAAAVVCDAWRPVEPSYRPTLGVPTGPYLDAVTDDGRAAFEAQVGSLADGGYRIRRVPLLADRETIDRRHRTLLRGEWARVHDAWFDRYEAAYNPTTAEGLRDGRTVTGSELARARDGRETLRRSVHDAMDDGGIDLWIWPAARGPAPAGFASTGSSAMNRPWSYAGLPAATVPAGSVDGLPVGLQCVARRGADERLLATLAAVERVVGPA